MNHQEIKSILKMLNAVERKNCFLKLLSNEKNQYVCENGLITVHRPIVTSHLRESINISAINLSDNYIYNKKIHSNSGSVFFFTGDFKYVIKTIRESERITFLNYIDRYYFYLKNNPSSYLLRIVGCYTLTIPDFCTLGCIKNKCTHSHNVLLMKNIFKNTKIDKIYDLKGKSLARGTNNYIRKDVEWYEEKNTPVISSDDLEQMYRDITFLEKENIMDYSLLIYYPSSQKDLHFELHNARNDKKYTVYLNLESNDKRLNLGIVDILTNYDWRKRVEYLWNSFCICKKKSCLNPKDYRERLLRLIEETFKIENDTKVD